MTLKYLLSASLLYCTFGVNAAAQTVFVNDAKVVTNTEQGILETTDVLIIDGRITQMGSDLTAPEGAEVLDKAGQWVTPGLFAPFAQIGLVEIDAENATNDSRASKAKTSVSDLASDSFNPMSPVIDNSRIEGITHAAISARATHDIFAGTGSLISTTGAFDSVLKDKAFIFVQLGERGAGIAGGSRSASLSHLRGALQDALRYPARYDGPADGDAISRRDAAALADAARGRMPLLIAADRAVDILKVIDLKREFGGLDIIILGASEGWMVADQMAEAYLKVMVDPHDNLPGNFENVGARLDNVLLLQEAGVDFAIMSRSSDFTHNVRLLPQHAGNAVGNGLDWEVAFKAISQTPAAWFGMRSGQLTAGVPSTLIVWDGDPLEVTSSPKMLMIDGQRQSLTSRQTELRDRYNPSSGETIRHKYR